MRKLIILFALLCLFSVHVEAMEFTAPAAPEEAQQYMPEDTESFAEGLWKVIKAAISSFQPSLYEAMQVCASLIAVVISTAILQNFTSSAKQTIDLVITVAVATILLRPSGSYISLGVQTVQELSEYGKLLLPVMTTAMAAQGAGTTSAALYTGTALFDSVLSTGITKLITPLVYMYIALCVACCALEERLLKSLRDFAKWLMTWMLKIAIYIFTGYLGITGVISGTADAAAIKAAKLTISGAVPVVGSIISDASETILVSVGVMKNAVGIYGMLAMISICIGPFLKIGIQYILLKLTAAVCCAFGNKQITELIGNFSSVMGFLLAMTGTVCLLFMISIVCFMKGIS